MAVATRHRPSPAVGRSVSFATRRRCGDEAPAALIVPAEPPSSTCAVAAARNGQGLRIGSLRSYKMLPKIGEGAFGVVRKALHRRTGELVAIKSSRGAGAGGGEALLREAAMLAECAGNPAVVQLREVARGGGAGMDDDGGLHLVMEFVGPSLHDVMDARRRAGLPFTESEARRAMRRLLRGVEEMHGHGVVHCDLKPGNMLIGGEEEAGRGRAIKICDLGLARSVASPASGDMNTHLQLEGTLWYMAPEQLLGDDDMGAPVDLWALGCVMAELVAGEPIFGQKDTVHEHVIEIAHLLGIPDEVSLMPLGVSSTSTPSRLRDIVPEAGLSPAGYDVLRGLLEFDPKDRLTAAAALRKPWFSMEDDD
ncbi:hypothetical protein ACP70R_032094 [Stipagrostis hirtigluma subsp. patula]